MKRILKDYFTFSRKERTAVIILLLLIIVFIATPSFYRVKQEKPVMNKALADFIAQSSTANQPSDSMDGSSQLVFPETARTVSPQSLFSFDPNTLSPEGWKKLGLTDRNIRTILNYRGKGGRFRLPEDIGKVWGIPKETAELLVPYVHIAEKAVNGVVYWKKEEKNPAKSPAMIDINTATREEWQALPGISGFLAERIVKYRERAGGFITSDQVKKTYGISDSVFSLIGPYLQTDPSTTPKTDLNTANYYELKNKAGIPEPVVRAILIYRRQYGPFRSVADLKKIVFVSDSLYQKLSGNLRVN